MTASDFINAGIPIDDTPISLLYAETAIDWIERNTTLKIDKNNLAEIPAGAKLFIMRYSGIMERDTTVASESLGGMSQSFSSSSSQDLLYDLASELIGDYLKSQVNFIAAQNRWE